MKNTILALAIAATLTSCGGGSDSYHGLGFGQLPSNNYSDVCNLSFYKGIIGTWTGETFDFNNNEIYNVTLEISPTSSLGDGHICSMTADLDIGIQYAAGSFGTTIDSKGISSGLYESAPYPIDAYFSAYSGIGTDDYYALTIIDGNTMALNTHHGINDQTSFLNKQ